MLPVEIMGFKEELAKYFTTLNLAWLNKYFVVEPIDQKILSDPKAYIIDKGGYIFFAVSGNTVAGTFALIKIKDDEYELSKMAVDEAFQGKNIGNELLKFCIREAKRLAIKKLTLYSNTRLKPAIHLYTKYGFTTVPLDSSEYARSDIKMEKNINNTKMKRIEALFSDRKRKILNIYCTAGFPKPDSTIDVLNALHKYGANMAEIGIPYSDPLADGPVIQQSNAIALRNGMTIRKLFHQLKDLRLPGTPLGDAGDGFPVILMGYLNPVLQYGIEKFCHDASAAGIDGVILPDLPLYEFENSYQQIFEANGLDFTFLVTPETSPERIQKIDEISRGFIYAVSTSATTGRDTDVEMQQNYFKKLSQLNLKNPVLVGFGIRDKKTFELACKYTNGAVIGSAYIKALQSNDDVEKVTKKFLNEILK